MAGDDAFEEVVIEIVRTAVVRHLEQVNLHLAVLARVEQADELQSFEHLVAARIARQEHALVADCRHHAMLDRFGTDLST